MDSILLNEFETVSNTDSSMLSTKHNNDMFGVSKAVGFPLCNLKKEEHIDSERIDKYFTHYFGNSLCTPNWELNGPDSYAALCSDS